MFEELKISIKNSPLQLAQLLPNVRLISEQSRYCPSFTDPTYIAAFYQLGKFIKPDSVLEIGFGLGLKAACFLLSSTVKNYKAYQFESEIFYFQRLGIVNVKAVWDGLLDLQVIKTIDQVDRSKLYDAVFINDQDRDFKSILEVSWDLLSKEGLLIVDYINSSVRNQTFITFCQAKNREFDLFETRYGLGIVRK